MRRRLLKLILSMVIASGLLYFGLSRSRTNSVPAPAVLSELPSQISELGQKKLSEIRTQIASLRAREQTFVETNLAIFRQIHDLHSYAFKEEVRQSLMDDLLVDERAIPLAKKTLLDHDFANQSYGDEQAIARVYSIALLEYDAKKRGSAELFDTAKRLANVLAESGDVKRRSQDLDDLVYAFAKLQEPDALRTNLSELLRQFKMNEHTADAVRDGFFFALKEYVGEEQARAEVLEAIEASRGLNFSDRGCGSRLPCL